MFLIRVGRMVVNLEYLVSLEPAADPPGAADLTLAGNRTYRLPPEVAARLWAYVNPLVADRPAELAVRDNLDPPEEPKPPVRRRRAPPDPGAAPPAR